MNLSISPINNNIKYSSPSFGIKKGSLVKNANIPEQIKKGMQSDEFIMQKLGNEITTFMNEIKVIKEKLSQITDKNVVEQYKKRIAYFEKRIDSAFRGMQRLKTEIEHQIMKSTN